jgi:hypothetical protein
MAGSMKGALNGKRLMNGAAVLVLAVLVWAWIDGGKQPLRDIAEPVAVPGAAR